MNKTILSLFVIFIFLGLFSTFANAKSIKTVKKTDKSGCYARSITKCGIGKCATSRRCRSKYVDTCKVRYQAIKKCSAQIKEKCSAHKVGSTAFVACQRGTAAKHCVSKVVKGAKSCDCKRLSTSLCGTSKTPAAVKCRDDAFGNCKKSCKQRLPCHPNRRICISDSNCNCKSIAKTKCVNNADKDCYAKKLSCCQKKCQATSRCFKLSCKNAGFARCSQYTKTKCAKYANDAKQRNACKTQTIKRCRAYELATCHRARRLFKFRSQCDKFATFKCAKVAKADKCQCFGKVRKICVDYKIKRRERIVRRFADCKKIAVKLCDEKNCKDAVACYKTEAKRCAKREHRRKFIIPKDCVTKATKRCGGKTTGACFAKFTRRCSDKWLGRYCENNAFKTCNANIPCMTQEIKTCRKKLPKCWGNRKICNDKNTCTTDVCDPKLGCLNIPKTCNDKNECTKDVCDPKRGCVHTAKDCNDGVACTVDTCDKKTGLCLNKKVHTKCASNDKCTTGICTEKGCVFNKDEKCKKTEVDQKCKELCKPANACENVECVVDKDLKFTCKRSAKVCNKNKSCIEGACDVKTGSCKYTLKKECKNSKQCDLNVDCVAWGANLKLADKCEEPLCDVKKGVCVAVQLKDKTRCAPPPPPCVCKPRNACEAAKCVSTPKGEVCQRTAISCDDKDACTVDRCDLKTGKCIHSFRKSAECVPCKKVTDCAAFAKSKNLAAVCKEAVCDAKLNKCVVANAKDTSKCAPECIACKKGPCDAVASCVMDVNKKPVCKRVAKSCDDKNDCTVDSCDLKTGECVHKAVKLFGCAPLCLSADDCKAWGDSLKLAKECKTATCDLKTGACVISKLKNQSQCKPCVDTCKPRNKCETTFCAAGETCQYVSKSCDDGVACTVDSCDLKTGKCVHKFVPSKTCVPPPVCKINADCKAFAATLKLADSCKAAECDTNTNKCKIVTSECPTTTDEVCKRNCKAVNACEEAICVPENKGFVCKRTAMKCDDKDDCTVDTCDRDRGCVHTFKASEKCKICVTDVDCDEWNKKMDLAKKCKKAVCDTKVNKCQVIDTKQTCQVTPKCINCVARKCETAECVFNNNGNPECKRTPTKCDDKDACTVDFCDIKSGKCSHRQIAGKNCAPICKSTVDCKTWAVTMNLANKCQEAVCDTEKGGCKVQDLKDKSKCTPPVCVCPQAKPCETVSCAFGANGLPVCKSTPKSCSDNNDCTVDSCDAKSGNCINTFKKSDKCEACLKDDDCKAWSTSLKLEKSCSTAFCEKKTGTCKILKKPGKCICEGCVARSPCETADCVKNAKNQMECKYTHKCDDGKECTRDFCDLKKNVCVNEFVKSKTCTVPCVSDNECTKMAQEQKLSDKCQSSFCNKKTGSCDIVPVADKTCVPTEICAKECKRANACETVGCKYNELKQVVCSRVEKDCNDKKECTQDSCDKVTGLCVNKFITNERCVAPCVSNADCLKWGASLDLAKTCQVPVCVAETGSCKAVKSDDAKCVVSEEICKKSCPTGTACETVTCVFDNNKAVCSAVKKSCDDKKECTKDSCDIVKGCVHEFVKSSTCVAPCEKTEECIEWGKKNNLADKCEEAFCDAKTGSCAAMKSPNKDCSSTEIKKKCELECSPANGCELTKCIVEKDNFRCERTVIPCNDNKECTKDSCDTKTGKCVNVFVESEKCKKPCENNVACNSWALTEKLSDKCLEAVCNLQTGSCESVPMKDDKTCTTSLDKCKLSCTAKNACDVAECVKSEAGTFSCKHSPKSCDDFKVCTADSCDAVKGCQHTFKASAVCPEISTICEQNLDCKSWGVANKLFEKCEEPVCDQKLGICKAVASSDTTRCKPSICNVDSDCPQPIHGAVCEKVNGEKRCIPNECTFKSDCADLPIDAKTIMLCTRKESSTQKVCKEEPKCLNNTMCDDNNPCTTDICWTEYGFCHHVAKCDDENECTEDIAIADKATKTCKCANVPKVCTNDISLVTIPFNLVTDAQKSAWLGKCIKEEGCSTCVKNEQCDDNNGCTADSCEKQFCIHKPIHNEWCDPKVQGQPINFQSIPGLRDKLKIAGYDLDALMPK